MGIDIYAKWPDQTEEEKKAQITGFNIDAGHTGYLREAYHGEPYATKYLLPEAFEKGEAEIPAATLKERLPKTLGIAAERAYLLYKERGEMLQITLQSFIDFVELCETKEKETGKPCNIIASY